MKLALLLAMCSLIGTVGSSATSLDCAERNDSLYAKGCSSSFMRCHNKQSYSLNCPAGLVFNPDTAKCDYSSNVAICLNRAISKETVVKAVEPFNCTSLEDGLYGNGKCTRTYVHCFRGQMAEMPCPPNLYFRKKTKVCEQEHLVEECSVLVALQGRTIPISASIRIPQSPSSSPAFDCSRKTNGLYSSEECSRFYWQCSNGLPYFKVCANELYFNEANGQCDYEDSVPACTPSTRSPLATERAFRPTTTPTPSTISYSCEQKSDGLYRAESSCADYFWMCVNFVPRLYKCPLGLYFNGKTAQCDFIGEVFECNGGISAQARQRPTPAIISFSCDGKVDGFYQIGTCVDTFVQCSGAVMLQQKCPSGLVFSAQLNICEYLERCRDPPAMPAADCQPEHGRLPDGPGGKGQPKSSLEERLNPRWGPTASYTTTQQPPIGPLTWSSTTPASEEVLTKPSEEIPSCTNLQDGSHSYGKCSNLFFNCWSRRTIMNKCPSYLVFNPYIGQCDFPTNVPECNENNAVTLPQQDVLSPIHKTPQNDSLCRSKPDGHYSFGCESFFYVCQMQQAYRFDCPLSLYFGNRNNQCDVIEKVPACRRQVMLQMQRTMSEMTCDDQLDGYYSTGCSKKYFACAAGTRNEFECPGDLVYDDDWQACNYPELVFECGSSNATLSLAQLLPTAAQPETSLAHDEAFCIALPNGLYGNGCSAQYYICANSKAFPYSCAKGKVFNERTSSCDRPSNVAACKRIHVQHLTETA